MPSPSGFSTKFVFRYSTRQAKMAAVLLSALLPIWAGVMIFLMWSQGPPSHGRNIIAAAILGFCGILGVAIYYFNRRAAQTRVEVDDNGIRLIEGSRVISTRWDQLHVVKLREYRNTTELQLNNDRKLKIRLDLLELVEGKALAGGISEKDLLFKLIREKARSSHLIEQLDQMTFASRRRWVWGLVVGIPILVFQLYLIAIDLLGDFGPGVYWLKSVASQKGAEILRYQAPGSESHPIHVLIIKSVPHSVLAFYRNVQTVRYRGEIVMVGSLIDKFAKPGLSQSELVRELDLMFVSDEVKEISWAPAEAPGARSIWVDSRTLDFQGRAEDALAAMNSVPQAGDALRKICSQGAEVIFGPGWISLKETSWIGAPRILQPDRFKAVLGLLGELDTSISYIDSWVFGEQENEKPEIIKLKPGIGYPTILVPEPGSDRLGPNRKNVELKPVPGYPIFVVPEPPGEKSRPNQRPERG